MGPRTCEGVSLKVQKNGNEGTLEGIVLQFCLRLLSSLRGARDEILEGHLPPRGFARP